MAIAMVPASMPTEAAVRIGPAISSSSRARLISVRKWKNFRISAAAQQSVRPRPAESARTLMEVSNEGTLSTLSSDGWPIGSTVQFALDGKGQPIFCLRPEALHAKQLLKDYRSSLHTQLDQNGRRAQCTLKGRILKADRDKLGSIWERKFGDEYPEDHEVFTMSVEQVLQSHDLGDEEVWVEGAEYTEALPDPLKDSAQAIVEDLNRKHWEDIRRFCRVYGKLEAEIEQASLTWVDRLGFDMRVLTSSPQRIMEVRIPFEREAVDDRDARSLLTMMAQTAWERERNLSSQVMQLA